MVQLSNGKILDGHRRYTGTKDNPERYMSRSCVDQGNEQWSHKLSYEIYSSHCRI